MRAEIKYGQGIVFQKVIIILTREASVCAYTKITHTQTFGHVSANIFTRANILTHAGGHIEAAAANAGGRSRRRLSVGYVCVKFHRLSQCV